MRHGGCEGNERSWLTVVAGVDGVVYAAAIGLAGTAVWESENLGRCSAGEFVGRKGVGGRLMRYEAVRGAKARRLGHLPLSARRMGREEERVGWAGPNSTRSFLHDARDGQHDRLARQRLAEVAPPSGMGQERTGPIGEAGELIRSCIIQHSARSDRPSVLRSPVANWGNRKGPIGTQGCRTPHRYFHYRRRALCQRYPLVTCGTGVGEPEIAGDRRRPVVRGEMLQVTARRMWRQTTGRERLSGGCASNARRRELVLPDRPYPRTLR